MAHRNGNGTVSRAELLAGLSRLGMKEGEVNLLIEHMDDNDDGGSSVYCHITR